MSVWYFIGGAVLLLAAFLGGILFEKKNAAKIDPVILDVKKDAADIQQKL